MIHPPPNTDWADAKARRESRLVWRGLILVFVLLVIATPLLFNYFAAREWEETRAKFIADGETLDFHKLLPPTVPEADNFFAIPELKDIAIVESKDLNAGEPGRKRAALKSLYSITRGEPRYTGNGRLYTGGLALAKPVNLSEWRDELEGGVLELPAGSPITFDALLKRLDDIYPDLKPLLKGSEKTFSQITPIPQVREWSEPLVASSMAFMTPCNSLSRIFDLRACIAASAGKTEAAFESLRAQFKLAEAFEQEPMLLAYLVTTTYRLRGYDGLWQGLYNKVLSEERMLQLQNQLSRFDSKNHLLFSLRSELAAMNDAYKYMKSHRSFHSIDSLSNSAGFSIFDIIPGGFFDHNEAKAMSLELELLISPLKKTGLRGALEGACKLQSERQRLSDHWSAPVNSLVLENLGAYALVIQKAFYMACLHDQALTAIALERYFLKHQHYPDTLQKLVPEFLSEVPDDSYDSHPIRYALTPDGRFKLWHIGFDGVDDGGVVKQDKGGFSYHLNSPDYLGDWVWQYTPVPKSP